MIDGEEMQFAAGQTAIFPSGIAIQFQDQELNDNTPVNQILFSKNCNITEIPALRSIIIPIGAQVEYTRGVNIVFEEISEMKFQRDSFIFRILEHTLPKDGYVWLAPGGKVLFNERTPA
jgi:hypothetical protein